MADNIDVSFFIPVYRPNRKWLDEAVDSFIRLFERNRIKCELLLGDDGSPEDAGVQSYANRYPQWIRAWRFPVNRGIGAVSTELAQKAAGRYVASFDQDDIILPVDLDAEVEFMDGHPEYCADYAQKFLFNDRGFTGDVHGDILSDFQSFFSPKANINAMLIRREFLAAHEYFKPLPHSRINQDVWLMLRMQEDGKLYYSRKPRALYRIHNNQNSHQDDHQDWLLMSQDVACRHSVLYRKILLAPELPAPETPEEAALLPKMAGLVFFCNQKNYPLADRLLSQCTAAFPDDHGVWETRLRRISQGSYQEFFDLYAQAEERFRNNSDVMTILTGLAVGVNQRNGRQDDKLLNLAIELEKQRCTPTQPAREALARLRPAAGAPIGGYSVIKKVLTF